VLPRPNPVFHQPWTTCTTCGLDFPTQFVRLHYRYGWQCVDGNPWGTNCWAGGPQRDEIDPPIYPGEGARRTPAPRVDEDEGLGAIDALGPYVFWLYNQSDKFGTFFRVTLTEPFVTWIPETTFTRSELAGRVWGGLSINNAQEWTLFIKNNQFGEPAMHYDRREYPDTVVHWLGSYFMVNPNHILLYTPPQSLEVVVS
jgi:hypothetical protein